MFRTSFLAAAGASRIPVRALRKGFLHSRKAGRARCAPTTDDCRMVGYVAII